MEVREIPVLFTEKKNCCGCGACYSICMAKAIEIVYDNEGFQYPEINESICIRCYRCIKVCPFKEYEKG